MSKNQIKGANEDLKRGINQLPTSDPANPDPNPFVTTRGTPENKAVTAKIEAEKIETLGIQSPVFADAETEKEFSASELASAFSVPEHSDVYAGIRVVDVTNPLAGQAKAIFDVLSAPEPNGKSTLRSYIHSDRFGSTVYDKFPERPDPTVKPGYTALILQIDTVDRELHIDTLFFYSKTGTTARSQVERLTREGHWLSDFADTFIAANAIVRVSILKAIVG